MSRSYFRHIPPSATIFLSLADLPGLFFARVTRLNCKTSGSVPGWPENDGQYCLFSVIFACFGTKEKEKRSFANPDIFVSNIIILTTYTAREIPTNGTTFAYPDSDRHKTRLIIHLQPKQTPLLPPSYCLPSKRVKKESHDEKDEDVQHRWNAKIRDNPGHYGIEYTSGTEYHDCRLRPLGHLTCEVRSKRSGTQLYFIIRYNGDLS